MKRLCGWLLALIVIGCLLATGATAEVIHIDEGHGEHTYNQDGVCTICGWMVPGFYMDGEMILSWDDMKDMGYAEVSEDGRLVSVSGNLDGLLVVGEDVTKVDGNMYSLFSDTPLKEVWLPRSVTELGSWLTSGTVIREVRLYCPVTELKDRTFSENLDREAHLERVWLPDTLKEIGTAAFEACAALVHLDLPDGIERLGGALFEGSGITGLTLPAQLRDMGSAFSGCSISSITLPAGVEHMADFAFAESAVQSADLSAATGLSKLEDKAFFYCEQLETLKLPEGLESFGWNCFNSTKSLKCLVLPNGFKSFGSSYLDEVETIIWPVSLVDVSISLPENLKTICYRGTEKQWKLCGANFQWDLSGITILYEYTGDESPS